MENNSNFKSKANAKLTAAQLGELYQILQESSVPYDARIRKAVDGLRQVTIYCDDSDLDYWQKTLTNLGGRAL
jgi:hypothetical protein